jgi:DnaJ-domain-containing protein 1
MSIFKRLQRIVSAEIDSRLNSKDKSFSSSYNATSDRFNYNEESSNSKSYQYSNQEEQYYANLELAPGASFKEIKKSYKRLLKQYHPDKYHNDDRSEYAQQITQRLNEAYNYFEKKYKE